MKTLLITGGAGFIGSHFVRLAADSGYECVVLDALTYAGHRENLAGVAHELVVGNICDRQLVDSLLQKQNFTAIIHMAAESHVDNSISSPGAFIDTNIVGTYTLLESLRACGKPSRFVHVSTDEVFGELGATGYFSEATPYAPNSPYSASKAASDQLVSAWHHTYGMDTIITHCSNNYGARQLPEKLIPVIITRALAAEKLPVYGDGKNVRDWIHAEDHAKGILLALKSGKAGEHYCFGGRAEKENISLVHYLCDLLDRLRPRADGKSYREQIAFVPDRLGHDRRYAIDDSKAERELGFTRRWNFEAGMEDTVKWYLANEGWVKTVRPRNK